MTEPTAVELVNAALQRVNNIRQQWHEGAIYHKELTAAIINTMIDLHNKLNDNSLYCPQCGADTANPCGCVYEREYNSDY